MGDRGNIVVQEAPGKRVYFYTHWRGSEITAIARKALARKQRWTDAAYLGRIVFAQMMEGGGAAYTLERLRGETSFGISTGLCDNGYPILVIDVESQTVWYENEEGKREIHAGTVGFTPFADFIKQKETTA